MWLHASSTGPWRGTRREPMRRTWKSGRIGYAMSPCEPVDRLEPLGTGAIRCRAVHRQAVGAFLTRS